MMGVGIFPPKRATKAYHYLPIEVLRHDAPTAVSEMEADKDGVRFGLDTPTLDVINSPNFYKSSVCPRRQLRALLQGYDPQPKKA